MDNFWTPAADSLRTAFVGMLIPGSIASDYMNHQDFNALSSIADRTLVYAIAENLDKTLPSPRNTHRAMLVLKHLKLTYNYENATGIPLLDDSIAVDFADTFHDEYMLLCSVKESIDNGCPIPDIIKSLDRHKQEFL